jgi:hypothetical protein
VPKLLTRVRQQAETGNGERVAILLDIEEYERMVAQPHTSPEPLNDDKDFDSEEGERRIKEFISSAEELPGPPVAELADHVTGLMRAAWREGESIMCGKPHNKVLATQLFLRQRACRLQADDPKQWRLFAGTTLLSGIVVGTVDH